MSIPNIYFCGELEKIIPENYPSLASPLEMESKHLKAIVTSLVGVSISS